MTSSVRLAACTVFVCLTFLIGCEKPKGPAESKEPYRPPAQPESTAAAQSGTAGNAVVLGADAPELKQMTIQVVKLVPVPYDEVTSTARIEANPNRVGHAAMPVPGRVTRLMVKLGDAVAKGQPLLAIESSAVAEAETGYVQSAGTVRQAELALAKAEADLARLTDLFEHQAVAQKEVLGARTAVALNKSSLEQANNGREQARRRLEILGLDATKQNQQIVVTAPLAGKVLEINVVEGEFRNEINLPLITITDLSRVWATSEVPESQIRYCRVGGTADLELIAYPNEIFHARVTRIADTVNSDTRTIKVSAELENTGGRLRPEMYGRLRYADGLSPSPWIPEGAVIRSGGKDFVFVEQSTGHFMMTAVDLGKSHEGGFSIVKGLKVGERIVTQGSVYLKAAM